VMLVPVMVVLESTMVSVPVPAVVSAAFMPRADPACARVWRQGPITGMPPIVPADWIPITFDPDVVRCRTRRHHNYARRRWRPNFDSNRHLPKSAWNAQQQSRAD
jgi:hypothetical protein